jgi:hypothetical protein
MFATATPVFAEIRGILVEVNSWRETKSGIVTSMTYVPPRISIYSEEERERRKDASLRDAAAVLKAVQNGSSVYVYIVFHHEIKLPDLITLLDILKDNGLFELQCVVSADSDFGKKELDEFKDRGAK